MTRLIGRSVPAPRPASQPQDKRIFGGIALAFRRCRGHVRPWAARSVSQLANSLATIRWSWTAAAAGEHSQRIGSAMTEAGNSLDRICPGRSSGIIPVSVAPPGSGHSRPEPARTAGDDDPHPVRPRARSAHGPKLASRRSRGPVNDRRTPQSVPAPAEPARQPHAIADTRRRAANRHHDDAAHPNRPRARTRRSTATHCGLRRIPLDKRDPPFGAPTVSVQEFVCAAPNVAFCARKPMMSAAAAMSIQTCRATGTRRTRSLATLASIARCGRGSQVAAFSTPSPPG
jgi:hypothetical protein